MNCHHDAGREIHWLGLGHSIDNGDRDKLRNNQKGPA